MDLPVERRAVVTAVLKALNTEFGEVRLSGSEDDPRVELALIGIDTDGILRESRHVDNDAARRRLVRDLLWEELKITDDGAFEAQASVTWRGTVRTVEVLIENASDPDRMPVRCFAANPGTIRMIIDYPFDQGGRFPSDDVIPVSQVREGAERRLGGRQRVHERHCRSARVAEPPDLREILALIT